MESPNDTKDLKLLVSVLLKRIDDLESEIVVLRSENVKLREEKSALQSRLKLNSKNSKKPPSSDGLSKAAAKKMGGQKGHTDTTLRMVEQPDEVVVHHAVSCPCCDKKFSGAYVTSIVHKRQVFDNPKPRLEATEHQLGMITCCGQTLYGAFPEKVSLPVQYGSRIKALSVHLINLKEKPAYKSLRRSASLPFMNYHTEQDIRHLKIKQKIATNFQTFKGAQDYARIQSFSSTLRKHSMNVFQNFIKILDGEQIVFQAG